MFPLIVKTEPENGARNIHLDRKIRVFFDGQIDKETANSTTISLRNFTTGDIVSDLEISVESGIDSNSILTISPPDNSAGKHFYYSLNEYKVTISGLKTPYGEAMLGVWNMNFKTRAKEVVIDLPEDDEPFEVLMTYPKDKGFTDPKWIKIKCNDILNPNIDKSKIMLIKNDKDIDSLKYAIFIGQDINIIDEDMVDIYKDTIGIQIPELESGKTYSVLIDQIDSGNESEWDEIDEPHWPWSPGILETIENEEEPGGDSDVEDEDVQDLPDRKRLSHMFSFLVTYEEYYGEIDEIRSIGGIKNILDELTNEEIAYKIYQNSKLAKFIAEEAGNTAIEWEMPAFYVTEYVKTKTQYDYIFDKVIELSGNATSKTLEDFTIKYGHSLKDLLALADKLKLKYQMWEDYLKDERNRGRASPGHFIKGESGDEIPDYKSRQLKDWEGGRSW